MRRRALRVMRPAREKKRRRRVLVVITPSSRPMRAVPGQVMRHDPVSSTGQALYCQPGSVGGEAPRGEMVESDAVLEVSNRILDLGVAAMIGLQFQGLPVPVGNEAVIAVGGEQRQLGAGRGLHPPDDEPHRCGVGLILEGGVEPVSEIRR